MEAPAAKRLWRLGDKPDHLVIRFEQPEVVGDSIVDRWFFGEFLQFFHKGTDLPAHSQVQLDKVARQLN